LDHFFEGGIVVGMFGQPYPVFAVSVLVRLSVAEGDHGGDRVLSERMRYVEPFDGDGRVRQFEGELKFFQRRRGLYLPHHLLRRDLAQGDFLGHVGQRKDVVPQRGGLLVIFACGGALHLPFPSGDEVRVLSPEKEDRLVHDVSVSGFIDPPDARRGTFLRVQVDAGLHLFERRQLGFRKHDPAGAQGEQMLLPYPAEEPMDMRDRRERPEIHVAVLEPPAGEFQSGKIFLHRELDERIGFVVLPEDVVGRLVPADQLLFDEEGFPLARGRDVIDVVHDADQDLVLGRETVFAPDEIRRYPFAEVDGFADVEERAGGVAHEVNTGRVGKRLQRREDVTVHGASAAAGLRRISSMNGRRSSIFSQWANRT